MFKRFELHQVRRGKPAVARILLEPERTARARHRPPVRGHAVMRRLRASRYWPEPAIRIFKSGQSKNLTGLHYHDAGAGSHQAIRD
jgi:hypothetical protein